MKRRTALFFALSSLSLIGASNALATTRYVDHVTGINTGNCTTIQTPCLTINYAIAQAVDGDTVAVGPGVYTETVDFDGNSSQTLTPKKIEIAGNGATGANASIIDASGKNQGVFFGTGTSIDSKIHGFTIKNASNEGVLIEATSTSRAAGSIYNCRIIDNGASGIRLNEGSASAHIYNNVIASNGGSGILISMSNVGASYASEESTKVINKNLIVGNYGHGIHYASAAKHYRNHLVMHNNTVVANTSDGLYMNGVMLTAADVRNTIFAHNTGKSINKGAATAVCQANYDLTYNNATNQDTGVCTFTNSATADPQFAIIASGTSSNGGLTATTLTDSSKNWATDQYAGYFLVANATSATTQRHAWVILGNTSTTLTVASTHGSYDMLDFDTQQGGGDPYLITDYSLSSGSPAINQGDDDSNYADADGSRNDIGFTGAKATRPTTAFSYPYAGAYWGGTVTLPGDLAITVGGKTYLWTQTSGTPVWSGGTSTDASPTFTAPATTETLTFQYTVADTDSGLASEASQSYTVHVHAPITRSGGSGSFATIQSAIHASSDGETITIPAGTYTELIDTVNKGLILDGAGASGDAITLIDGSYFTNSTGSLGYYGGGVILTQGTTFKDPTIRDMKIANYGLNCMGVNTGSETLTITLDNVELTNCGKKGSDIYTSNAIYTSRLWLKVKNSFIHDNKNDAITVGSMATKVDIANSVIAANGGSAMATSNICTLTRNIIAGNANGIACPGATVENNLFIGNDNYGYQYSTSSGASTGNNLIRNNTLLANDPATDRTGQLTFYAYNGSSAPIYGTNNLVAYGPSRGVSCYVENSNVHLDYNYSYYNTENNYSYRTGCGGFGTNSLSEADSKLLALLDSGASTSISVNTLTDTSKNWEPDAWKHHILVGNATSDGTKTRMWLIKGNTETTLTLYTSPNYELTDGVIGQPAYVAAGQSYQIISGSSPLDSLVINSGSTDQGAESDYNNIERPKGCATDIGAFELDYGDLIANAGADQLAAPGTATLDGTASYPQKCTLAYTWTEVSDANDTCTLSESSASKPSVTLAEFSSTYTCTYTLVVSDGVYASSPDSVTLTVTPTPTPTPTPPPPTPSDPESSTASPTPPSPPPPAPEPAPQEEPQPSPAPAPSSEPPQGNTGEPEPAPAPLPSPPPAPAPTPQPAEPIPSQGQGPFPGIPEPSPTTPSSPSPTGPIPAEPTPVPSPAPAPAPETGAAEPDAAEISTGTLMSADQFPIVPEAILALTEASCLVKPAVDTATRTQTLALRSAGRETLFRFDYTPEDTTIRTNLSKNWFALGLPFLADTRGTLFMFDLMHAPEGSVELEAESGTWYHAMSGEAPNTRLGDVSLVTDLFGNATPEILTATAGANASATIGLFDVSLAAMAAWTDTPREAPTPVAMRMAHPSSDIERALIIAQNTSSGSHILGLPFDPSTLSQATSLFVITDNAPIRGIEVGNINGDAYDDLIIVRADTGSLHIFLGQDHIGTTASLETADVAIYSAEPSFGKTMTIGDVTGDGIADIVVRSDGDGFGKLTIIPGTRTWSAAITLSEPAQSGGAIVISGTQTTPIGSDLALGTAKPDGLQTILSATGSQTSIIDLSQSSTAETIASRCAVDLSDAGAIEQPGTTSPQEPTTGSDALGENYLHGGACSLSEMGRTRLDSSVPLLSFLIFIVPLVAYGYQRARLSYHCPGIARR